MFVRGGGFDDIDSHLLCWGIFCLEYGRQWDRSFFLRRSLCQISSVAHRRDALLRLCFARRRSFWAVRRSRSLPPLPSCLRTSEPFLPHCPRALLQQALETAGQALDALLDLRLVCHPGVRTQLSDEVAEITAAKLQGIKEALAALIATGYDTKDPNGSAELLWALFLGLLQQA